MKPEVSQGGFTAVFLFPMTWRPLKRSFAGRFELLSQVCRGYIFTTCGPTYRKLQIGNFYLYSQKVTSNPIGRSLGRFWVQTIFPVFLLWRKREIDAIIAYDPYASGVAGSILKRFLKAKLIVEINGDFHRFTPGENIFKKWLMNLAFHFSLRNADAVKVLNKDQETFFMENYPEKPLYRFSDYVATDYFISLNTYRGDYLLSIGYPFYIKGMDILIQAFGSISKFHPKVKLKIMGYCTEDELLSHRQLVGSNSNVEFVSPGWIEEVGEQLRGCYAYVSASRWEAMGKVILEAMACRKPVVSTRTNGGVDYVDEGRTGLLSEIENVDDLAKKMDYLLSHPDEAERMGEAGLKRVEQEYSEEKYVLRFLDMLEEIVHSKNEAFS